MSSQSQPTQRTPETPQPNFAGIFETVVVKRGGRSNLHIPESAHAVSHGAEPGTPICKTSAETDKWTTKDHTQIPEGFFPNCALCARRFELYSHAMKRRNDYIGDTDQ